MTKKIQYNDQKNCKMTPHITRSMILKSILLYLELLFISKIIVKQKIYRQWHIGTPDKFR